MSHRPSFDASQGFVALSPTASLSRSNPAAPTSPNVKMPHAQGTSSQDSVVDGFRKRVCKACDRCRLKKSKCNGAHPCARCKVDNAICMFGEKQKFRNKVYPKGYIEMLEQQQGQLVSGLQEVYRRLQSGQPWKGPSLTEVHGFPLIHDILAALNLLRSKHDGSGEVEMFEEDCEKLQSKLIAKGAGFVQRPGSSSSDSDHSQKSHLQSVPQQESVPQEAPAFSKPMSMSKENGAFSSGAPPLPSEQIPVAEQRQSYPVVTSLPLHAAPISNDPQLYQADWAIPDMTSPAQITRSKMAMQDVWEIDTNTNNAMNNMFVQNQQDMTSAQLNSSASLNVMPQMADTFGGMQSMHGFGMSMDPMDVDFSGFIHVSN